MTLLDQALRGAHHSAAPPPPPLSSSSLLVLGAGGTLGAAVLADALGTGGFRRVQALVSGPLQSTLRGFQPLPETALASVSAGATASPVGVDAAVLVFERGHRNNGRDEAYTQPQPADLLLWSQRLHAHGVRHLMVVLPHSPALLPEALRHGLATLDEGAVAALGFEQLVFVRTAQQGAAEQGGSALERFARWWLSQLRWLVPDSQRPWLAVTLARCVVELARQLPAAPHGTRVLVPESLVGGVSGAGPGAGLGAVSDPARLAAGLHGWLRGNPPP